MEAKASSRAEQLRSLITQRIRSAGGWLSFEDYMQLALHEPGLGYYAGGSDQLGREGDFVTGPEIGSLFARCIARFAAAALPEGGSILELGGGSGRLLRDMAAEMERLGASAREYLILDTSAQLADLQDATLADTPRFARINALPQSFCGVIIANEVLDALPCRVLAQRECGWIQCGVRLDEAGQFAWADGPAAEQNDAQRLAAHSLPVGYRTEINRRAEALAAELARSLEHGTMLLIDYGFAAHEYYHPQRSSGTLMGHLRHRTVEDVLAHPGECDLTAHVDFSAISAAAAAQGASVSGFATQESFLIGCGIADLLADNADPADWGAMRQQSAEARTLLMPQEMGTLFKALALTRGPATALPGFGERDLSSRL